MTKRKRKPRARSKRIGSGRAARRPKRPAVTGRGLARRLPFTVVGVGASAGGLEAFIPLLEAVPENAGLAIVFVQHLAPSHDSALPALLAPHSRHMPVTQATDGALLEPNHVYVIPPGAEMQVEGYRLTLSPRPMDRTHHTPIDTFFTSMASIADGRCIAVVLSGTASDGALGIRDVKSAGGIAIAQKPESAKYDGMPRAAIGTGLVDLVLTPAEIGAELAHFARHPYVQPPPVVRDEEELREEQLKRIFELLRPVSGVDFRHYKLPTIRRRLLRRMALHRLTEVDSYVKLLQSNPSELRGLFQDLLIHVTRFFREPESFAALAKDVFPKLVKDRSPDRPVRIWVCGCATGEEAYSLAIALVEFLQRADSDARIQIFATDVSENAIDHARTGVYPASIAADVSAERLRRFFTKSDGNYRVSKTIRDLCVFARQDLTRDPPFSRLDLIMCRNVLIYLDAVLQRKLMSLFHYALNPHGYLVLGQAETVGAQASLFTIVDKKHRVHRRQSGLGTAAAAFPVEYVAAAVPRKRAATATQPVDKGLQAEISRIILDRYAPAGVVVDAEMQIVQFRGQTGTFLEPAPGEASLNLLKMAREGLLYGLRTALHTARKTKAPVRKEGLQVRSAHGWKRVTIEVLPLGGVARPHFLILFDEVKARAERGAADLTLPAGRRRGKGKAADESQLVLLQRELAASREYLQSIIQELEAANEELQSANEEILSSNEELQSTNEELDTAKEELQSTNEELNTVNEELHGRNEEMSRVNSDLVNLVGSVQIAIVIVSSDLRIRRFTPMAEKILNLIPADLDRAIGHINPNINCPNLDQLIIECMDTVALVEREVQDRQGHWYSLRIRPYKSLDNKIDGAVLALFDVDLLKRSQQHMAHSQEFADAVLDSASQPLAVLSADLRVRQANAPFAAIFGLKVDDLRDRALADVGGGAWRLDGWAKALTHAAGAKLPAIDVPDGGKLRVPIRLTGRMVPSSEGEGPIVLVSVANADTRS